MDARDAQNELKTLFLEKFDNVKAEWQSNANTEDWLQYGNDIYAPRPDIAIGPFNTEEGHNTFKIDDSFQENREFFDLLHVEDDTKNSNPRCLVAIEIENSNKGKHMLGNIINASVLGRIGIIVALREEFYDEAVRVNNYLKGAFEKRKMGHNPSNLVIVRYEELRGHINC